MARKGGNHVTCPDGKSALVVLELSDDDYSIRVYVPEESGPLEDDSDFFANMTEDGARTGINIPDYLNNWADHISLFEMDKAEAAELSASRCNELECLQGGGFIPDDVEFRFVDLRK